MENFIVAGILTVLIGAIIFYLVREKKKGRKCIGCPYAKQCMSKCVYNENKNDIPPVK